MKTKITYALLAMICMLTLSCSSSKDNEVIQSLNGTTWISPDDGDGTRQIKFFKTNFVYESSIDGVSVGEYSYDPPYVTLAGKDTDLKGRIKGDKLIIGEIEYKKSN